MMLAHALTLTQARSYLAALADGTRNIDASSGYELTLIELDRIHANDVPALDTDRLTDDRAILYAVATSAIEELVDHGVDDLQIELVLAMLADAHTLETSPGGS